MKYHVLTLLLIFMVCSTCRKVDEYFRFPDTEVMAGTIVTGLMTGFAANAAMESISGHEPAFVSTQRSNAGFPCTTLMTMEMDQPGSFPFPSGLVSTIVVAGLWADDGTGILTMLFSSYNTGTNVLSLIGIETIPVIRHDGKILVVLADMDIRLDPDQQSFLDLNLDEMKVSSEYERLYAERPQDVYMAIEQHAYFIDIDENSTPFDLYDDSYALTGGGQLVEATFTTAEVIQQAMVDVLITPECNLNPVSGWSLMQATGAGTRNFPELGSVLIQFHGACDGQADVVLATGMYFPSNGSTVNFTLQ